MSFERHVWLVERPTESESERKQGVRVCREVLKSEAEWKYSEISQKRVGGKGFWWGQVGGLSEPDAGAELVRPPWDSTWPTRCRLTGTE